MMSVWKDIELYFIGREDPIGGSSPFYEETFPAKGDAIDKALDRSYQVGDPHCVFKVCHLGVVKVGQTVRQYGLSLHSWLWSDEDEKNTEIVRKLKEMA